MEVFKTEGVSRTTQTLQISSADIKWDTTGSGSNYTSAKSMPIFATDIRIVYGQQATPNYSLNMDDNGNQRKLLIKGAPEGNITMGSLIFGSTNDLNEFISAAGKTCKTAEEAVVLYLRPATGCSGSDKASNILYTMRGVDMNGIQVDMRAGQGGTATLAQQLSFTFTELDIA